MEIFLGCFAAAILVRLAGIVLTKLWEKLLAHLKNRSDRLNLELYEDDRPDAKVYSFPETSQPQQSLGTPPSAPNRSGSGGHVDNVRELRRKRE